MTLSLQRSSLHLIKVERDTVTGSSATVPCEADGYIGCIIYAYFDFDSGPSGKHAFTAIGDFLSFSGP